jgi:hypothetical protein
MNSTTTHSPARTLVATLGLLMATFAGCHDSGTESVPNPTVEVVHGSFSQFFLEKGSDADSSYISFRGTRDTTGAFRLEATSWAIRETGPMLYRVPAPKAATFIFMAECGTVSSHTWEKTTLTCKLAHAELDTLLRLELIAHGDSLAVVKTWIVLQ